MNKNKLDFVKLITLLVLSISLLFYSGNKFWIGYNSNDDIGVFSLGILSSILFVIWSIVAIARNYKNISDLKKEDFELLGELKNIHVSVNKARLNTEDTIVVEDKERQIHKLTINNVMVDSYTKDLEEITINKKIGKLNEVTVYLAKNRFVILEEPKEDKELLTFSNAIKGLFNRKEYIKVFKIDSKIITKKKPLILES